MKADPFLYLSDDGSGLVVELTEEQIERYKAYYGLEKPLHIQYIDYLKNIFTANLGYSIHLSKPVSQLILERAFWTISIVVISLLVSVLLGSIIGSLSAWFRYSHFDNWLYHASIAFSQIPDFINGTIILLLFSTVFRGLLPTAGGITPFMPVTFSAEVFLDLFLHAVLPLLTLIVVKLPDFYLLMRASMLNEIDKLYVLSAQAKGLKDSSILFKHCFINAINPMFTRMLMSLGKVFGGAFIIENIFEYPGVGKLMRDAVFFRDYILIQSIFFFVALLVLLFSQLTEIIYQRDSKIMEES